MKYNDYEALINEAISNADKAPVNLKTVLENIKADLTTLEAGTAKISEYESRIADLQDTNIKLFLGSTSKEEEHKEPEDEKPKSIEDIAEAKRKEILKDE